MEHSIREFAATSTRLVGTLSILVAVVTLTDPATASAHSVVLATSSPRNAVVAVAPTQVTTTWNEKVTQVQESVTGPDQAQWSTGSVHGTGSEYSVALRPSPPPGVYTVNWQVKSDDGDIVNGSWTFTVSPASGQ